MEDCSQRLAADPSIPRLGERLVVQMAVLREEMAQIRQNQQHVIQLEAPPAYDGA